MSGRSSYPSAKSMGAGDWALLFFLGMVWGGSFFFVEIALEVWPPLTVVWLRLVCGAIVLWVAAGAMGHRPPMRAGIWATMAVMALFNNVLPFLLFAWGQTQIASGLAAILNATTPLFTAALAAAFLKDERLTLAKVSGIVLGVGGVAVMIGPDLAWGGKETRVVAILACLCAASCYAVAAVFGRRFARGGIPPLVAAAGQVSVGAALLGVLIVTLGFDLNLSSAGMRQWGAVAGLALLSTGLAYGLYFRLLAKVGATNLSLVTILIPVSAIVLGALFLDERLAPQHFSGMAIIALALLLIDGRVTTRLSVLTLSLSGRKT